MKKTITVFLLLIVVGTTSAQGTKAKPGWWTATKSTT
jgi:hypothetical protein